MANSSDPTDPAERSVSLPDAFTAWAFCWADLLLVLDRTLSIVRAAGPFDVLTGRRAESLPGTPLPDLVVEAERDQATRHLGRANVFGRVELSRLNLVNDRGRLVPVRASGYFLDPDSGILFLALRRLSPEERLTTAETMRRDPETGLLNGDSFAEMVGYRMKELCDAGVETNLSLVEMADLDEVEQRLANDDQLSLSRRIGEALRAQSVAGDSAGLVAPGRFGVLHRTEVDISGLGDTLQDLTAALDPESKGARIHTLTLDNNTLAGIDETDLAQGLMHTLNRFRTARAGDFSLKDINTNLQDLVSEAVGHVETFRRMVHERAFDLALQPIVSLKKGDIHHYEALARFRDGGPHASPWEHISFAEDTGMIHDFDLAMARKVVEWLAQRPRNTTRYRVAVNISGRSVSTPAYAGALHRLLDANPWTEGLLLFEITESARMTDLDNANAFVQGLRRRGYPVCLDDFGAGAASFQYLSSMEVDVVKLDGSALRNARRATKGRAFLSALAELCRRLGVETVAEMVEDRDDLEFVRGCGIDHVQGYLFGRPAADISAFNPLPNHRLIQITGRS